MIPAAAKRAEERSDYTRCRKKHTDAEAAAPLAIGKMYCGYVSSNSNVEEFNMHTKSDTPVPSKNISLVINENDDNALNILKRMYKEEKEKNKDLSFEFLDGFMEYLKTQDDSLKLRRR